MAARRCCGKTDDQRPMRAHDMPARRSAIQKVGIADLELK